ncbi:DUF4350 domain-containing protein [Nocardioides ferulae]|uniref:DUF4350 domain-containing protein n=1 Tax=Nocardioides ferulae TaxID=2340821 RepID=UPI000EAF139E|nr:DUF4350 domain-containing protein [Nocardioides ferulae]
MNTSATARPGPDRWRRWRAPLLIGSAVAAAITLVVLSAGGPRTSEPLDPDNPGPDGARAVARVLADQGVEVHVVRGEEELRETRPGPGTTVLVTATWALGASTAEELRGHSQDARLVVAGADVGATRALGLGPAPSSSGARGVTARCDDPALEELLGGLTLSVDAALAYPGRGCFGVTDGALLAERDGVLLLGAAEALTNDQVLRADNAALALRLLGRDPQLVWYVPDPADLNADDGVSLGSLLPPWLAPALLLALAAVAALALWRGRRLGPLVTEPLPVTVRAIETTLGRGRMYRKAGDRRHAAEALREATRDRVGARLRLGRVDADTLVAAVAAGTGRPAGEVAALLSPAAPSPATDDDLIRLAGELATLEEEVRRP